MASSSYCVVCRKATDGAKLCRRHKDCTPAEQLRVHLERARESGLDFDRAWPASLRRIAWPHDTPTRLEWKAVLGDGKKVPTPRKMRESWGRAYERMAPSRPAESAPGLLIAA